MSVIVVFYIIAIACAISLIGVFALHKLKYIIWRGYFRAIIVCEDGDIIIRTPRLKLSDTDFTLKVKGKLDTYHIIEQDDDGNRRVYRIGRFRIPTSFYNAHQSEPIDMQNLRKQSEVSATRYREIAKNTVTSQLLNAFSENPLREAMALMLAILVIMGGMLILGYFLNSRIEVILERLGGA